MPNATTSAVTPIAASILVLLAGIERHDAGAPAAIAFRAALARKGREADAVGGLAAIDALLHEIADADPERADARTGVIRGAWADFLPGSGGRGQP